MTAEDQDRLWADPGNWNPDGSYRCAADPRFLVPHQRGMGWTLNMEHPRAGMFMVGVVFAAVGIVFVVGLVAIRRSA
jgi:uncharacterized membrane protein